MRPDKNIKAMSKRTQREEQEVSPGDAQRWCKANGGKWTKGMRKSH